MSVVSFVVYGLPRPAGSKRAFQHRHTGQIVVTDANKNSHTWKQDVATAAAHTMNGAALLDGPLILTLVFMLPRPKGHYGKKGLRPSAPRFPAVKPDLLKLARGVEDALSGIVYRDDAQIVSESLQKAYGEPARVHVEVRPVDEVTPVAANWYAGQDEQVFACVVDESAGLAE